jgi:hypothetical protein
VSADHDRQGPVANIDGPDEDRDDDFVLRGRQPLGRAGERAVHPGQVGVDQLGLQRGLRVARLDFVELAQILMQLD